MPHVIVKLIPGRSEEIKMNLAKQIAEDVSKGLNIEMGYVSVAFEEVGGELWREQVYKKEIKDNSNVYIQPNHKLFE